MQMVVQGVSTRRVKEITTELHGREKVIRIFPNLGSVERLVGALCAETHEEGSTGRRCLKMEGLLEWQTEQQTGKPDTEEPSEQAAVVA